MGSENARSQYDSLYLGGLLCVFSALTEKRLKHHLMESRRLEQPPFIYRLKRGVNCCFS